jgi:chromosomal replication initiation ATPase DnaA
MSAEAEEIAELIERVGTATGLGPWDIMGGRRDTRHARARFAVWLVMRRRGMTFARIGRAFGRDHRTVMHGVERGQVLAESCEEFAAMMREVARNPRQIRPGTTLAV